MSKDGGQGWFLAERVFHYVVMVFMVALMVFAAWFVYKVIVRQQPEVPLRDEPLSVEESKDGRKTLPDFVLEDINNDELEKLKP